MALGRLSEVIPVVSGESSGKPTLFAGTRKRWILLVQRIEQLSRSFSRHITSYATSLVVNEIGADVDFRVEGVDEPNLLVTVANLRRVGIGTESPEQKFHVLGTGVVRAILESTDASNVDLRLKNSLRTWHLRCVGPTGDFSLFDVSANATPLTVRAASNSNTIAISTGGAVGMSTFNPASRLDIDAGAITQKEMALPPAPANGTCIRYAQDAGGGKTKYMIRFPTGAPIQLAIEP